MSCPPQLSIIIPCYNAMPFLRECLASVCRQIDSSVEVVVVDDGSTDESATVVGEEFGSVVRLIRQPNAGASTSRNRGVAETSGELIVWLDADDVLSDVPLSRRIRPFLEDDGLQMLVQQYEVFTDCCPDREVFPKPPCDTGYVQDGLLARWNLPHLNAMTIRRSALSVVGPFDTTMATAEDWDFWVRAWTRLRWRFDETIVAHQRQGFYPSASRRPGKSGNYRMQGTVLRKNREILRYHFGSDRPWREAYRAWQTDFALVLLREGRRVEAASWSVRALLGRSPLISLRAAKYLAEATSPWAYSRIARLARTGSEGVPE